MWALGSRPALRERVVGSKGKVDRLCKLNGDGTTGDSRLANKKGLVRKPTIPTASGIGRRTVGR